MPAKRWMIDGTPTASQLAEIAEVVRAGGVVILPTDTLYGLHADARNAAAIAAIQSIKKRDAPENATKPLLVLCESAQQAMSLGVAMNPSVEDLLSSIWPAPLTVILPLTETVPVSAGMATIGIRVPAIDWLRQLAGMAGPLASTSVNESGEAPAATLDSLPGAISSRVAGIADAGPLEGRGSTILDLSVRPPSILRQGEFNFSQELWKTVRKSL